ncbi:MAG: hypothetical protein DWQ01_07840 [Planctomycetota bacterium]|nr:MAG: hypothetical protein DWQ01_07840 [Planctomycetota bacterium]
MFPLPVLSTAWASATIPVDATASNWGTDDTVAAVVLGFIFLFLLRAALQLRRIKKLGLEGHPHRKIQIEAWHSIWPQDWPSPKSMPADSQGEKQGWLAGPLDHDGRLLFLPLEKPEEPTPEAFLKSFLESRLLLLDEWDLEEMPGRHGTIAAVEGRAKVQVSERGYVWAAWIPGPQSNQGLMLLYRASVLFGLADGFWLHEVATRFEYEPQSESVAANSPDHEA